MDFVQNNVQKTKNWIIQGGVATPHLSWYGTASFSHGLEELAPGYGVNYILTFFEKEGDDIKWVFDEDYVYEKGEELIGKAAFIKRKIREWEPKEVAFYEYLEKLERNGISNLEQDYKKFLRLYRDEYSACFFTEYLTTISDRVAERIKAKLPELSDGDFQKLILPHRKAFINEETESALKIALKLYEAAKKEKKELRDIALEAIKAKYPLIYKALEKHQKEFFWLRCNYKYTEPIDLPQFLKDIKESVSLLSIKDIKERIRKLENYEQVFQKDKQKVIESVSLSEDDLAAPDIIAVNGWWHDRRKRANLLGSFWANVFLQKASKEHNIDLLDLQFTLPKEFIMFLETEKIDKQEIEERKKACLHYSDSKGREEVITGEKFENIKNKILGQGIAELNDLRGTIASGGVARGKVRVVVDASKEQILEGEILVTSMTRPEFVPLMKKAKAVVTDEGGLTSHAAIISRELGIPCIVGTKIATRALKSGDTIEVNANHGVVKVLKRG